MKALVRILVILALLVSPLFSACEQTQVATPTPVTIRIVGSNGMRPVLQALTIAFTQRHPSVIFDLRGGGSRVGEDAVRRGEADLAASTLLPIEQGPIIVEPNTVEPLLRLPIGIDGVAIIVHQSNLIESLSLAQMRDLFGGRLVDWSAVGGESGEILLVSREDGSGARQLFESKVMDNEAVSLTAVVMPTSADVVDYVARNPQAMGYVSRSYVLAALESVNSEQHTSGAFADRTVRVMPLDGKLPLVEQIQDSSYLLSRPIFLVSRGEPQGWSREFVEFALSLVGQEIVGQYHASVR